MTNSNVLHCVYLYVNIVNQKYMFQSTGQYCVPKAIKTDTINVQKIRFGWQNFLSSEIIHSHHKGRTYL